MSVEPLIICPHCGNTHLGDDESGKDPIVFACDHTVFHRVLEVKDGTLRSLAWVVVDKRPEVPEPQEGARGRLLCLKCSSEWQSPFALEFESRVDQRKIRVVPQ